MLPTDTAALARGDPLPRAPHDPGHWVRDERIACVECGAGLAMTGARFDAMIDPLVYGHSRKGRT
jgi:hypothetical protein